MEAWEKVMKLEHYIGDFVPKGCKESIKAFDFAPAITYENYTFFEQHYNDENFTFQLQNYGDVYFRDDKIYRFRKPYIIEAIKEYFNQNNKGVK